MYSFNHASLVGFSFTPSIPLLYTSSELHHDNKATIRLGHQSLQFLYRNDVYLRQCRLPFAPLRENSIQKAPWKLSFVSTIRAKVSSPPANIGATAKQLRQATQQALQARSSRMILSLPVGARLGMEKIENEDELLQDPLQNRIVSNRDLARYVLGMFDGTGVGTGIVFMSEAERKQSYKVWSPTFLEKIVCKTPTDVFSSSSSSALSPSTASSSPKGFGNTNASTQKAKKSFPQSPSKDDALFSDNIQVILFVGPKEQSDFQLLEKISEKVGMDVCVILINPIFQSSVNKQLTELYTYVQDNYDVVYYYQLDPHPQWSGGILFRKFPENWVLCRKAVVGMNHLLETEERPSLDDIAEAFKVSAQDNNGGGIMSTVSKLIKPKK